MLRVVLLTNGSMIASLLCFKTTGKSSTYRLLAGTYVMPKLLQHGLIVNLPSLDMMTRLTLAGGSLPERPILRLIMKNVKYAQVAGCLLTRRLFLRGQLLS